MAKDVGARRLAGYGIGDVGFNLYWTGLNVYLLIYYTDVLKIDPVTAGFIFGLSIFWDAVSDPIMGLIVTRTRTRWGKFRPFLLFGAPFMGAGFVMMFAAPILFPSAIILASAISHLVFRTLFTVVSIPYSSLSSVLTTDSDGRSKLAGARMLGAITGALVATALMPSLAEGFGGGDLKRGWAMVSVLFAVVATVLIIIVFFLTRENDDLVVSAAPVRLSDSLRFLKTNYALWVVFAAMIVASAGNGVYGKSVIYFIKYNLGAEGQTGPLLGAQTLIAAFSIPFWVWLSGKTSKRITWMIASVLLGVTQRSTFLINPAGVSQALIFFGVIGASLGAYAVMFWSIVPDTVEYGQWRSGIRDEGMAFSISTFAQKSGVAAGVAVLGLYLGAIGYAPDVDQGVATLDGIRRVAFLYPGLIAFAVTGVLWFYPIDRRQHAALLEDIAKGNIPALTLKAV